MSPVTPTIAAIAPELLSKARTAGGKVLDSMNNEVLSVALNDDLEWVSVEDPSAVFKLRITPGIVLAAGGIIAALGFAKYAAAETKRTGGVPVGIGALGGIFGMALEAWLRGQK